MTDVPQGWEHAAGRVAEDVAYWDVVAALATPPDMGWFPPPSAPKAVPTLTAQPCFSAAIPS
jgi:hypothetical protein